VALGLLGGAFDPPHNGHVALARAAMEALALERLVVLVSEHPGHKRVWAPAAARVELARAAFADLPDVVVELDPYARTVDLLEERRPADAYFVLGGDELAAFWTWKRPERVLELVRLAVGARPGTTQRELDEALVRFPPGRVVVFEMPALAISSSELRARVQRGEGLDDLVPASVSGAIGRLGLYRGEYTRA
jgi:nicotinate-nucleotide adenylyltransferase